MSFVLLLKAHIENKSKTFSFLFFFICAIFVAIPAYCQEVNLIGNDTTIPFYDAGNLLANSDFEEGFPSAFKKDYAPTDGWLDWHSLTFEEQLYKHGYGDWDETVAYHGKKSISCIKEEVFGLARWQTPYFIPLQKDKQYVLKGFYKTEGEVSGIRADILPRFYKSDFQNASFLQKSITPSPYVARLEPSEEWKSFVLVFQYPHPRDIRNGLSFEDCDFEGAVRFLTVSGPGKCWFDYLKLSPRFVLEPVNYKVPIICQKDDTLDVQCVLLDESKTSDAERIIKTPQEWEVHANDTKLAIENVSFKDNLWHLKIKVPDKAGSYDVKITVSYKNETITFAKTSFLNVTYPIKDTFAVAVMADRHMTNMLPASLEETTDPRELIHLTGINLVNNLNPLFMLELGDNGIWDAVFKTDSDIKYRAHTYMDFKSRIIPPIYSVAGNHEADATNKGIRSRWYYHIYSSIPYYYSFDVGSYHFVGLDSVMGVNPDFTVHGGDFQIPGMLDWLAGDLKLAANNGKKTICFFHHPLFTEFKETPNRQRFLDMVEENNVMMVLTGHHHHTNVDVQKRKQTYINKDYPSDLPEVIHTTDQTPFPPTPEALFELAKKYHNNPNYILFETCPPLGASHHSSGPDSEQYQGIRYIWIKDGKVAWDDVLPANMKITHHKNTPYKKTCTISVSSQNDFNWRMRNAADRAFKGLPLRFVMEKGDYKAYLKKSPDAALPLYEVDKGAITECWVQVDLKPDDSITVIVERK